MESSNVAAPTVSAADLAEQVYDQVRRTFGGRVTAANVVLLVTLAMTAAEKAAAASGPQKKDLVLAVVNRLVDELAGADDRDSIKLAVGLLAPGIIDGVVAAAKGQLDLGGLVRRAGAGWRRAFPCCSC